MRGPQSSAPVAAPASVRGAQGLGRDIIWGLGSDISAGFQSHVLIPSWGWRGVGTSPPGLLPAAGFGGEGPGRAEPPIRGMAAPATVSPTLNSCSIIFASPSSPSPSQLPDE